MFFGSQKFDFGNARISRFCKGNKMVLAAESTGDDMHNIPMMKHITTTHVKSAWLPKGTKKKEENNDSNHNENGNIIDVLSLIPAEILNSRNRNEDLDASFDEETRGIDGTNHDKVITADDEMDVDDNLSAEGKCTCQNNFICYYT